jgi:small subunit ribosomal protein S16
MPVKIRLQRHGRSKRPFYHIVVADSRNRRDGKFIERIGDYNPLTIPATINLNVDRAFEWVMNGAQPTDTVRKMLTFKGVMYKKHLQRGVTKGAFDQEEADKRFNEWAEAKMSKVQERMALELKKIEDKRAKRNEDESAKRSAKLLAKEEAETAAETEEETVEAEVDAPTESAEEVETTEAPVEENATEEEVEAAAETEEETTEAPVEEEAEEKTEE